MSLEEQIMSKEKYPSISSHQMEAIVSIILHIFLATRAVLKIGEYLTTIYRSGGGELWVFTEPRSGEVNIHR